MNARRIEIVSDDVLKARALELSQAAESEDAQGQLTQLVVLLVSGEYFGIAVDMVREVVKEPMVTALPLAPAIVAGVTNLRGEILAILNLEPLLGLPAAGLASRAAVVVEDGHVRAALLVDRVDGVDWFPSAREPLLATVPADSARFLTGAYRSGRALVTEINVSAVLTHPDLQPAGDGPA